MYNYDNLKLLGNMLPEVVMADDNVLIKKRFEMIIYSELKWNLDREVANDCSMCGYGSQLRSPPPTCEGMSSTSLQLYHHRPLF